MEAAIERNQPGELLYVPVWVSMDPPDCAWAQGGCVRLCGHPDVGVRGNAILGFGHLARTSGALDRERVKPLIEGALHDPEEYVRGQADSAARDVTFYLGWQIEGFQADES